MAGQLRKPPNPIRLEITGPGALARSLKMDQLTPARAPELAAFELARDRRAAAKLIIQAGSVSAALVSQIPPPKVISCYRRTL